MEDIRKTTKMQKQINGKTYDVEVEVIRRKHLTGGIEFKINVTIRHDGHEVHDTAVENRKTANWAWLFLCLFLKKSRQRIFEFLSEEHLQF